MPNPLSRPTAANPEDVGNGRVVMSDVRTTADVLEMLARSLRGDSVQLRDILSIMGDRSMGSILLIVTLPQVMPIPVVLSNVLALPVLVVTAQMALGIRHPWLPRWLLERPIRRRPLAKACIRLVPLLRQVEKVVGPRPGIAQIQAGRRLVGWCCFVIAALLLTPLPLATWLPAWSLFAIALGLLERDGLVILGGLALGAISLVVIGAAIMSLIEVGEHVREAALALPA